MTNRFLRSLLILSLALPALASAAPAGAAAPKKKAAAKNKAAVGKAAANKPAAAKPEEKTVALPFSVFQSTAGLKVGGPIKWTDNEGNHIGGAIKSIDNGVVTVRLEPQKVFRREVPFTVFPSTAGAKVGTPVTLNFSGTVVSATIVAIGTSNLTVEIPLP